MEWINSALGWFADFFQWLLVEFFWGGMLDGMAGIIEGMNPPDFFNTVSSAASTLAVGPLAWVWSLTEMSAGLTMICTAYVLRFVLRRIPFIGG